MKNKVYPGIHENAVDLFRFNLEENKIIEIFSKKWYVTTSRVVEIGPSIYKSILIKPTKLYQEMFNLSREIIVAFSLYEPFEPRSIDAIDYVTNHIASQYQELRLEEVCSIMISKDSEIEKKITNILKKHKETRVIIPFSYDELIDNKKPSNLIENRFRKHFYSRDLLGIGSPLRKDLYFFGRRDFVHELVNRHQAQECSGIFGLRKTGKTSILYGVQRVLSKKKIPSIWIDCQNLHFKRWNKALYFIISQLQAKYGIKKTNENRYSEDKAPESFEKDILIINKKNNKKGILLLFDEIEHITFRTSASPHWKTGNDFIYFWQVLRSIFQKYNNVFTYLIAGTNPLCIEQSKINGIIDNPINLQFQPLYIKQFDVKRTNEMINKLGGYMGLKFDDSVCTHITEDFGGHPFLIRQVCSVIHSNITGERPILVNKVLYKRHLPKFISTMGDTYSNMILEVLEIFYPDEFYMLELLSNGDTDTFNGLSKDSPQYTNHLLNYGILEKTNNTFSFKIEILKEYLGRKNRYKKLKLNNNEKQIEISKRRNSIEIRLREMVRKQLIGKYGIEKAKEIVLKKHTKKKQRRYANLKYKDLFNPIKHEIYFDDLRNIISNHWEDCFSNFFNTNVDIFNAKMKLINFYRKVDAHASKISNADMNSFRGAIEWLEEIMDNY